MRISKLLCVLAATLFISVQAFAQSPKTKKADEAYNNWQWSEAIELYKKALTKIEPFLRSQDSGLKKSEKLD
jgi:hypothetical protein